MASNELDLKIVSLDRVYHRIAGDTLVQWAVEGRIAAHDLARLHGTVDWKAISEFPWLAASLPRTLAGNASHGGLSEPEDDADAEGQWVTRRSRNRAEDVEIDMTPMIDVTFQLLIFFMLTNSLVNPAPLSVPEAVHGMGISPEGKQMLLVDDKGRYYLGESTRDEFIAPSLDALITEVTKNASASEAPLEVIISAHKAGKHVHIRELVDRLGGVPNVGKVMLGVEEKRR